MQNAAAMKAAMKRELGRMFAQSWIHHQSLYSFLTHCRIRSKWCVPGEHGLVGPHMKSSVFLFSGHHQSTTNGNPATILYLSSAKRRTMATYMHGLVLFTAGPTRPAIRHQNAWERANSKAAGSRARRTCPCRRRSMGSTPEEMM